MRHLHTDSHFRLAIAALQDSRGYVDTLLGLARDQIMARQPSISPRPSRARGNLVPRNGWSEAELICIDFPMATRRTWC
jgi:hypothetical protein